MELITSERINKKQKILVKTFFDVFALNLYSGQVNFKWLRDVHARKMWSVGACFDEQHIQQGTSLAFS